MWERDEESGEVTGGKWIELSTVLQGVYPGINSSLTHITLARMRSSSFSSSAAIVARPIAVRPINRSQVMNASCRSGIFGAGSGPTAGGSSARKG